MMQDAGMIELNEKEENKLNTLLDIKENPHNYEFATLDVNQAATNLNVLDAAFSFWDNMFLAGVEPNYILLEEVPEEDVIEQFSIGIVVRPEAQDENYIEDIHKAFANEDSQKNIEEVLVLVL